jgi:hypothetical protein
MIKSVVTTMFTTTMIGLTVLDDCSISSGIHNFETR